VAQLYPQAGYDLSLNTNIELGGGGWTVAQTNSKTTLKTRQKVCCAKTISGAKINAANLRILGGGGDTVILLPAIRSQIL
jgi:hypothetical protein